MITHIISVPNVEEIELQNEKENNKSLLYDESEIEWMYNIKN